MSEVTLNQLTEGTLEGKGVFDVLMQTVKVHLEEQFNKGAIRGTEYATVYLGQLESSMQTALAFLAQNQRIGLEATLLEKQIALVEAQTAQANAQIKLIEQQAKNAVVEGRVLEAQECKLKAEYNFTMKNVEKAGSEIQLLVQKTATEKAQIMGLGVDEDSVIGRQKGLYIAQTRGFQRDAEQKVASLFVDVYKTFRMTDSEFPIPASLDATNLGKVLEVVKAGINVPTP